MGFVTDFIWRSPLGLRINAQATADVQMTEDWVRIRGDQLVARDGDYDLRITAELWETHFFDLVSLLVVDHPGRHRGVRRRAVRRSAAAARRRSPPRRSRAFAASATITGRDVLDIVRARDDRHLDFAGRGSVSGRDARALRRDRAAGRRAAHGSALAGRAGLGPSDRQLDQRRARPGQSRAAATVCRCTSPMRSGRFRPARTGLGFPAGKDKTVLIDLVGRLPGDAGRGGCGSARTSRSSGTGWDGPPDGPDVKLEPRRLELKTADLRFRGYSVTDQKDASTPERPRYVIGGVARTLARSRRLPHALRRRSRAAADGGRSLRDHERRRRAAAGVPGSAAARRRARARLRARRRRLGEGRRLQHGRVTDGAAAADASVAPVRPGHRAGWRTIRSTAGTRRDFERYHTRYVSPDAARDALRVKIEPRPSLTRPTTMKRYARPAPRRRLRRDARDAGHHPALQPSRRGARRRGRRRRSALRLPPRPKSSKASRHRVRARGADARSRS